jgi:hypothetical protein
VKPLGVRRDAARGTPCPIGLANGLLLGCVATGRCAWLPVEPVRCAAAADPARAQRQIRTIANRMADSIACSMVNGSRRDLFPIAEIAMPRRPRSCAGMPDQAAMVARSSISDRVV